MGSFSSWHWVILIVLLAFPLVFLTIPVPVGPNRFGPTPQPMNFTEAVGSFFRNYVNFRDRASRSEFWYVMLLNVVVSFACGFLDPTEILGLIWSLATLLPLIAVTARRLHDINRSGWYQLLASFAPVGTIMMIVWWCLPPKDG